MKFKRNMGLYDQIFRTVMGLALIYLGPFSDVLTSDMLSESLLAGVGIMIIISSLIGWCPLYHIAGFNSHRRKQNSNL